MATLFEAYVTNAGKYSEGQLVGETLKFPTTAQEVEALLKRIGVDGVRYQEIFITSFDGDVLGLYDHLSEYENLDELACRVVFAAHGMPCGSSAPPYPAHTPVPAPSAWLFLRIWLSCAGKYLHQSVTPPPSLGQFVSKYRHRSPRSFFCI